jgi:D-alanyl-D-alanine carboxypeptidase
LDSAYEGALAENKKDVAELLKKSGAHEPAPPITVDAKVLESYAGTFKTETLPLDIKVFVKEGKLYLQAAGQGAFAPKPKSPTVFAFAPANLEIEFDSPSSFTLKQGGMTIKFKKAVTQ